jgi:hypothetical protein
MIDFWTQNRAYRVNVTLHARCIRGHWHCIHGECGVIDPACKIWHCMHDWQTIRTALAAFKGKFYQNIYVPELSYPTLKRIYINFKGLPDKKFPCMCWHRLRMIDFCVRKSIISQRIRSRIQKGFSPWIRSPRGIVWWKNRRVKISWHCPFISWHCPFISVETHTI